MQTSPLLSRVASSTYWMSRYVERAENIARFIDVNLRLMLDARGAAEAQWRPLIDTSGDAERFEARYGAATRESVVEFLTFDRENPNSILSCLDLARDNALSIRDTIASEMWQEVNQLYTLLRSGAQTTHGATDSMADLLNAVKRGCHLFRGLTDSTMTHTESWQFVLLGRMLERADKTTRILDVKYFILLPQSVGVRYSVDEVQWGAVLRSVTGFEMYRKRVGRITPAGVAEFMLLDRTFPRSVRYCVASAADALSAIAGTGSGMPGSAVERQIGHLRADLDYTTANEIIAGGLHEFLDDLQLRLNRIDDAIFARFFALRETDPSRSSQSM